MSTFKQNCGIPVDFEGFQNCRSPKDIVVFFDDFLGASFSATADAAPWFTYLITTGDATPEVLNGTDEALDEAGGVLKLAVGDTADEGLNLSVNGQAFHLADGYPLYFEARVNASDIVDIDWFVGLSSADTTGEILSDGTVDNIGFKSEVGTMSFNAVKGSGTDKEVDCNIAEAADDWIRIAFFWDGIDTVTYSVDENDTGEFTVKGTLDADTAGHMVAQDAMMTPMIEAIAAATGSQYLYVDYILCMQTRFHE